MDTSSMLQCCQEPAPALAAAQSSLPMPRQCRMQLCRAPGGANARLKCSKGQLPWWSVIDHLQQLHITSNM